MTAITVENNFEFERLLKILISEISEEQKSTLDNWNALNQAFKSSWLTFSYGKTRDDALITKEKLSALLNFEPELNICISNIFQDLPDPRDAVGLWDEGKERKQRQQYEEAIISIKKITQEEYVRANATLPALDSAIDKPPCNQDGNLETFLVIENSTAGKLNITTAISSEEGWASGDFRPDLNFNDICINAFSYSKQREDIYSANVSAEFIVKVSMSRGDTVDEFSFIADQSAAGKESENNKTLVISGPSAKLYTVIQSVPKSIDGIKGLVISIIECRGE